MSRHNNYRNYSNAGNRAANAVDEAVPVEATEEVMEGIEVVDEVMDAIDVDESASLEIPVESTTEAVEESQVGKVVKCKRLNIRKNPSKDSDPVCIVDEGAVLMIDLKKSTTPGWYAVYTEAGVKGYCMKDFVKISK